MIYARLIVYYPTIEDPDDTWEVNSSDSPCSTRREALEVCIRKLDALYELSECDKEWIRRETRFADREGRWYTQGLFPVWTLYWRVQWCAIPVLKKGSS